MWQPLVAASRSDDRETRGTRPIHEIADECGLVAVREAVHHARFLRLAREDRAAERVRLDRDHHHVLAVTERGERMLDCGRRVAGGLDDDIDSRMRDERLPVIAEMRAPLLERGIERCGAVRGRRPADALEILARVRRREVCDPDEMNAGRLRHLRDIHRGKLACADQTDAQGPALRLALLEQPVQVHLTPPSGRPAALPRACRPSREAALHTACAGNRPAGIRSA